MPKGVPKISTKWKEKHDLLLKNFNRLICHLRYFEKKHEEIADAHTKYSCDKAIARASANAFSIAKTLARDYRDDMNYLHEINLCKQTMLDKLIKEEEKNGDQENGK